MSDKSDAAEFLINRHFEIEPGMEVIYRIMADNEDDPDEPIKLLEVNADSLPTRDFNAFGFGPSEDVPFTTLIAEVTPDELERLRKERRLPPLWDISRGTPYYRSVA